MPLTLRTRRHGSNLTQDLPVSHPASLRRWREDLDEDVVLVVATFGGVFAVVREPEADGRRVAIYLGHRHSLDPGSFEIATEIPNRSTITLEGPADR